MKYYFLYITCFFLGLFSGYQAQKHYDISPYKEIIRREAKQFSLDPRLIEAIIMTESGGNVKAVSHKGALGLMQLLPSTAQDIAQELKINHEKENLVLPEINIRLGCAYVYQLMDRFHGKLVLVLASYNTGPNRVSRWLQEMANLPAEDIIALKASRETRNFVQQVMQRYSQ